MGAIYACQPRPVSARPIGPTLQPEHHSGPHALNPLELPRCPAGLIPTYQLAQAVVASVRLCRMVIRSMRYPDPGSEIATSLRSYRL